MQRRYDFETRGHYHYVIVDEELSVEDRQILKEILAAFPCPHSTKCHCEDPQNKTGWVNEFQQLDLAKYPKRLLNIAANAFDGCDNTVLGVACEYGKSVAIVQTLIDLGADVDAVDRNDGKVALHWAIANKVAYFSLFSDDEEYRNIVANDPLAGTRVLQCLLDNHARTDLTTYQNMTVAEYAEKRRYLPAAEVLRNHVAEELAKSAYRPRMK